MFSRFTKFLIGKKGNIWSVVYINSKCMYLLETRLCTIIECVIVWNVRHVTSTLPLISWWFGASNESCAPNKERPSWKSLGLNCGPELVWILYKSHYPNSSTFKNISWNISSLSITSSEVIFSIPYRFLEVWYNHS